MLASYCVCILLMAVYWLIAHTLNRRRRAGLGPEEDHGNEDLGDSFADKTDFQQNNFKYTT